MSRAVCISFHRYHPHTTQHYRVWMKALLTGLEVWGKEFDKLYLIDDYWDFNFEELDRLNKLGIKFEIIKRNKDGHHWVQFKTAIPHIKEDYCLFLDNDVLIWKAGIVDNWFKKAEEGKFVTAWDGSGGLEKQMRDTYPVLKENSANRMGSYYFILDRHMRDLAMQVGMAPVHYNSGTYIPELDYTTVEGDWQDSFGALTIKILKDYSEYFTIDDDRSSIYLEEDGIKKDPETPKQLGYYHVRNGGHTTYLLASKYGGDEEGYKHSVEITPLRELFRIMAWHFINEHDPQKWGEIATILIELGVSSDTWKNYTSKFEEYHGL